jgi:hypothetical protein
MNSLVGISTAAMYRRNTVAFVKSSNFNSPLLFCKFTDGSRRVTLQPRQTATLSNTGGSTGSSSGSSLQTLVHIIPMSHAATQRFFDKVIHFLASEMAVIGISDPHNIPPAFRGAVKILMEGLATTDEDRETEQREWQYIADRVKSARAGDKEADRFLFDFTHKVESNTLFRPETQKAIAESYELPFPLPPSLLLQDTYFRPLCAARFSPCLASGDLCLADYKPAEQQQIVTDPTKLRVEREKCCAAQVRRCAAAGSRLIFVPWGHFHAPTIMDRLGTPDDGERYPGSDLVFDVVDAEASPTSYGWTEKMLQDVYGIEPEQHRPTDAS